jgi:COMPASS component BRE2
MSRGRQTKQPAREREQREKKESLKKRESAASVRGKTPDVKTKPKVTSDVPSPMRFTLTDPKPSDYDPPKDTIFASHEPYPIYTPDGQTELKKSVDQ